MAQNVTINGQNYSAVPAVQIPKTGGGTAQFTDVSDTTAVAADVNSGKYIYLANGSKVQGSQNIYSISENFAQVTSNNSSSRILGGTSYVSELTPAEGSLIASVTVTMGGIDITDTVFIGDTGSGGGGITPTGTINISQNGVVDVTNYASANVSVPNSYSSSDEGKVVSNGALVAQGSDTVTQNGTVDTTLINSLIVNVGSGTPCATGTYTPTSDVTSASFDVGGSFNHFVLFRDDQSNTSVRSLRVAVVDWSSSSYLRILAATNNSGTGITGVTYNGTGSFSKSGTTVTYSNSSNKLANGKTYRWIAW